MDAAGGHSGGVPHHSVVCSIIILASWSALSSWCTLERRRAHLFSPSFESTGIC